MKNLHSLAKVAKAAVSAPVVCAAALCLVLVGCSGGGGGKKSSPSASLSPVTASASVAGRGRAKLTIKWPARSTTRLVPDLSQSIVVEVLRGTDKTVFDTKVVPRPADVSVPSVVTFDSLPVETLVLRASAHPNADGTGTAQSASETPLVIADGQETNFGTLTMGTTIATVTVVPPSAAAATPTVGSPPQQWTAMARDASGAVVLVSPDKQKWESSDTSVATVDAATGLVTAVNRGSATITETDMESGKSGSAVVSVASAIATAANVPAACQGVVFEVFKNATIVRPNNLYAYSTVSGGTLAAPKITVARASGQSSVSANLSSLAAGTYQVRATAYPTPTGTGTPQAIGAAQLVVLPQSTQTVSIALGTTIYRITISPSGVSGAVKGETVALTATAYLFTGLSPGSTAVVTLPSQFSWTSSNLSVATVDGASGLVTATGAGTATITAKDAESNKTASVSFAVIGPPTPQFNPRDPAYVGSGIAGDLAATNGDSYQFSTDASPSPILTDTTTNTVVATGQYVTQTFGPARTSVTYAVFDFAGDIHIGGGSKISGKGANPVVLMAQNNALIDGNAIVDISASGTVPGAGGGGVRKGPGAGTYRSVAHPGSGGIGGTGTTYTLVYGGGSFGGIGGNQLTTSSYGTDFATGPLPHLQGGSGGYNSGSGGALYLAAWGTLTIDNAVITARGSDGPDNSTGASGGGLALFGGGGVLFTRATLDAGGGKTTPADYYGGGGGGRIVIGYGTGSAPDLSLVTAAGGAGIESGGAGQIYSASFSGF